MKVLIINVDMYQLIVLFIDFGVLQEKTACAKLYISVKRNCFHSYYCEG